MRFYMNNGVAEIQGDNGKVRLPRSKNSVVEVLKLFFFTTHLFLQVKQVMLQNGHVLPADVVIVGIGKYKKIKFYNGSHFCVSYSLFLVRRHSKL